MSKKQGDFWIFGVVNGEKNEPISVISTILLESMVLLRMRPNEKNQTVGEWSKMIGLSSMLRLYVMKESSPRK